MREELQEDFQSLEAGPNDSALEPYANSGDAVVAHPGANVRRYLKRRAVVAIVVIAVVGLAGSAWADIFPPSHGCRKPYKPYRFTSEYELEMFREEVDRFEACIDRFVEEQNAAAQAHRDAAKGAIEDWNRFMRLELR